MAFGSLDVRHIFLTKGLHLEGTLPERGGSITPCLGSCRHNLCDGFPHCVESYVCRLLPCPFGRVMFRFSVDTDSCIWEMATLPSDWAAFLDHTLSFGPLGSANLRFFLPRQGVLELVPPGMNV